MVQSNYDFDSILDLTKFFVLSPIERKYIQSIEAEIRESVNKYSSKCLWLYFETYRTDWMRKSRAKEQKSRNSNKRRARIQKKPSTKRTRVKNS